LSDSLPVGLDLRVPLPTQPALAVPPAYFGPNLGKLAADETKITIPCVDSHGLCDFDELPLPLVSGRYWLAIVALL